MTLLAACSGQSSERRGGGDIPDLAAGSGMSIAEAGAGGAQGEAGGAGVTPPVTWCAAYKVINCVCQQCHQNPPLNGATLPLVSYDDTQGQYRDSAVKKTVWQEMQVVLTSHYMPYMGDPDVMPPVKALTDEQQTALLTWLAQGAHDQGGQVCPMACDWSKGPPTGNE